jgi:hypothetical protein
LGVAPGFHLSPVLGQKHLIFLVFLHLHWDIAKPNPQTLDARLARISQARANPTICESVVQKVVPKPLKSYALEAANETASDVKDGMAISHRSDESLDSFSLRIENPGEAAASGGFGGGMGGAVHFSGFSK